MREAAAAIREKVNISERRAWWNWRMSAGGSATAGRMHLGSAKAFTRITSACMRFVSGSSKRIGILLTSVERNFRSAG